MSAYYLLVFGVLALFFSSVIFALHWSIRSGQFSEYQKGARSIFDDDEPVGEMTDFFPDMKPDTNKARGQ
jgi:cbb3-type cytochrome oxidase maturation protein